MKKEMPRTVKAAQQSVHRTAGGLRVLSLIQTRNLVPFRELALPAAGNAGRWAAINRQPQERKYHHEIDNNYANRC
jgi:hypothetical protein